MTANDTHMQYDRQVEIDESDILFHFVMYKITVPILYGLISVIGIIGNSMVIIVICRRRHMRTTVNLSLLNLAFCDVIFVSICVPFVAYHYAADTWLMGEIMCKLFNFLLYVTAYVTVYTLILVSALRYLTVVHGAVSAKYRTHRNIILLICLIWAVMLIGNCPVLILYRVKTIKHDMQAPYHYCAIASQDVGQRIFISFFVLTYVLPLAIIATLYERILKYLNRKRKQSFRLSSRSSINGNPQGQAHERTLHATRIVIIVVVVLGACWLPLHIHLLIAYFGMQPEANAYAIYRILTHFVAYANSCLNPFIYNYASKDFRREFRELFRCSRNAPQRGYSTRSSIDVNELIGQGDRNHTPI